MNSRGKPFAGAIFILVVFTCNLWSQQTYTWNQTGAASFATAANWTPTRSAPATTDILNFNNGANTTATNVPTQTAGQLNVSNNTSVTFQAASAGNVLSLSSSLSVAGGSQLNISGTNAFSISLLSGAAGSISGSITFTGGSPTTDDHRLLASDANAIAFNSGATFTAGTGFDGNAFGNSGTSNTVVFAAGSAYVYLDGANPFGLTAPGSKVVFQTGSTYRHLSSSFPSASGRTYADFEFNAASTSISGGSAVAIDNLTILSGTFSFNMTGTGSSIKKNIRINTGATLNFNPGSSGTVVNFNGSGTQTISDGGTFSTNGNITLNVDSGSKVELQQNITIGGGMQVNGALYCNANTVSGAGTFTLNAGGTLGIGSPDGITSGGALGNIQTSGSRTFNTGAYYVYNGTSAQVTGTGLPSTIAGLTIDNTSGVTLTASNTASVLLNLNTGLLKLGDAINQTLGASATLSGGSAASYVQTNGTGVFKRTVTTSPSLFPVGSSNYNPARLNRTSGSDVFNARVSDIVFSTGDGGSEIMQEVVKRTWFITADAGIGTLTVNLQWNSGEELTGFNPSLCYVAHYTLYAWSLDTPGSASGSNPFSRSRSGITTLSPFTVASGTSLLPVTLTDFRGFADGHDVLLQWSTQSEFNSGYFQVEHSSDGRTFNEIGKVEAAGFSTQTLDYHYRHLTPATRANYYRLKQVDFDGKAEYSKVVSVSFEGGNKTTVFPTIFSEEIRIRFAEATTQMTPIELIDLTGRIVYQSTVFPDTQEHTIMTRSLASGAYYVRLKSGRKMESISVFKM